MINIPEFDFSQASPIRLPGEQDVLVTDRIRRILDTPAVQRLRRVSQLGLVACVYPGATHTRFEHSLGAYRLACEVLQQLARVEPTFREQLSVKEAETFLLAALLHDVGHWPYCHPIEDLQLDWVPAHEDLARELICSGQVEQAIREDWDTTPETVADFLAKVDLGTFCSRVLQRVLDGPIDIDKMDYLQRDSLHAGVPYGRNFDVGRLIASMCIDTENQGIAISTKGKTAAEMMVFARYVMFSEVYWHHTVRSATAMLQRLVYCLQEQVSALRWLEQGDAQFAEDCLRLSKPMAASELAAGLFGEQRRPFKRICQFSYHENPDVHRLLAGKPYDDLVQVSQRFASKLSKQIGISIAEHEVLIDAPPVKLEVQFNLPVKVAAKSEQSEAGRFVSLSSISPVVRTLATEQFDSFVKQVRVFAPQAIRDRIDLQQDKLVQMLADSA